MTPPTSGTTNPCGVSFLSYRRTAENSARAIIAAQRVRGIPTWRDCEDLDSEPSADALARVLESPDTANAVCWLTPDVEQSRVIRELEVPRILKRAQSGDGFFAELVLADGLEYCTVDRALEGATSPLMSLGSGWNLPKVQGKGRDSDFRSIACRVLKRRMRAIGGGGSARHLLRLHTRPDAPLTASRDVALQVDWSGHFSGRLAKAGAWEKYLLPALADITTVLKQEEVKRPVLASGLCGLPAAFALGYAFREPSGLDLTWQQHTEDRLHDWSLQQPRESSGFRVTTREANLDGSGVAVLIEVTSPVEPAMRNSEGLPSFRKVIRAEPESVGCPARIESPAQAASLARELAAAIRRVREDVPAGTCFHLFLAGPVGLAVLVGQQLNAVGPVQTYEHDPDRGVYLPAALLTEHSFTPIP